MKIFDVFMFVPSQLIEIVPGVTRANEWPLFGPLTLNPWYEILRSVPWVLGFLFGVALIKHKPKAA